MIHFEHQVRERAYYIWEGEGRVFGCAEAHWLRAEAEIRADLRPAPVLVRSVTPDLTLSASPAEVLGASLKARPSRARSVTAKAETKVKAAAKAAKADVVAEPAPNAAKTSKAARTSEVVKTAKAPAKTKASAAVKATKTPARARSAEAVATVH